MTIATKLHKNWSVIRELGKEDRLLMLVIACLDLENPMPHTDKLVAAFPECFAEEQQHGPYPLSYIRRLGTEMQDPGGNGAKHPQSYGVDSRLNMPCILLAYDEKQLAMYPDTLELRPDNISMASPQGAIVEYQGRQMVVLENNEDCQEIALVPVELIDVNS